jgi:penicillin-binding protein 2
MPSTLTIKDSGQEKRLFKARLAWVGALIALMAIVLLLRYFHLQIVEHRIFSTRADANRILTLPLPPPRGAILDRHGEVLADSRASFSLDIVSERTGNLDATLQTLQGLLDVRDDEIEKFQQRRRQGSHHPFEPVPLRYHLDEREIAILAVNEWRLPGVEVDAQLVRYYPFGELFAHSIGYTSSINEKDEEELSDSGKLDQYRGVFSIGKSGLERVYENELFGTPGGQNVETNARGQALRVLEKKAPVAGKNLTLFIDRGLQQLAADELQGKRGAAVAIEVKTGGVLAAASTPSFDPNLFVTGISGNDYNALRDSWELPMFNRVLQGQYPPGSTVKPMIALAGLDDGVITPATTISDPGWYQLPNDDHYYRDWKKGGHGGNVNLRQAIRESCDTYFYHLGFLLGVDRLDDILGSFGFGSKTGIDQTAERSGVLPSREWKMKKIKQSWFQGDTINMSIGQGDVLVTPMQLANAVSIIARRGQRIVPRFVKSIAGIETPMKTLPPLVLHDASNWDRIYEGMMDVIHSPHGTAAKLAQNISYHMAGKTGTAQVIGIKQDEKYNASLVALRHRDHALFIAFAPVEDPQIAVAIVVENGEHGASSAAPIAKAMIDYYLGQGSSGNPDLQMESPATDHPAGNPVNSPAEPADDGDNEDGD